MKPHGLASIAANIVLLAAVLYGGLFYALVME